jgi:hypothetical protein
MLLSICVHKDTSDRQLLDHRKVDLVAAQLNRCLELGKKTEIQGSFGYRGRLPFRSHEFLPTKKFEIPNDS